MADFWSRIVGLILHTACTSENDAFRCDTSDSGASKNYVPGGNDSENNTFEFDLKKAQESRIRYIKTAMDNVTVVHTAPTHNEHANKLKCYNYVVFILMVYLG